METLKEKLKMEKLTETELNKVFKAILSHSASDGEVINLGNIIEIKPVYRTSNKGREEVEGLDIYKYATPEAMEADDYDFDSDYICTVYL